MKLTNAAIIFIVVFVAMFSLVSAQADDLCDLTKENLYYNEVLDEAAFDVAMCMVEYDAAENVSINREEVINVFIRSISAGFGISGRQAEELALYIPVILVAAEDGFYINYLDDVTANGERVAKRVWTDKIPYSTVCDDGYIYRFSLGEKKEYLYLIDTFTADVYSGYYQELRENTVAAYLGTSIFEELRIQTITDCILTKMEYYINCHNRIAKQYGISYSFYLPVVDTESWIRSIDDISFLYLFQGYPYQTAGEGYYNRVALAGARVSKSGSYYVVEATKTYHKKDCSLLSDFSHAYRTREECALEGAYPCDFCNP